MFAHGFDSLRKNFHVREFEKKINIRFKSKYSLLFFYQSECGHCKTAIEGLIENYQGLVQKGIKIISIAGDNDQENYKTSAAHFPWLEKYCDVNGMNGVNFKNYAVIGTPTFYLLNSKGIIIEKIATINQLLTWKDKK